MTSGQHNNIELVWQNPLDSNTYTFKVIQQHLTAPNLKRFRVAVAWRFG